VSLASSTCSSVEPILPTSAEMPGRKRMGGARDLPLPTLVLQLSKERPKRAGSRPARHSAPWAVPSRVCIVRIVCDGCVSGATR
jgi:hypothetical protein